MPLPFKPALTPELTSAPFQNVTVPVGVPPLAALTVAVSVRVWPTVNAVGAAIRVVVVEAAVTVTATGGVETEGSSAADPP